MSQETGPDKPLPDATDPAPTPPPAEPEPPPSPPREEARLQRQTFVMVNDRGRMILLVALCTLAGVAVGFGLASLVAERSCPRQHAAARVPVGFEVMPDVAVPSFGFRSHGCDRRHGRHGRHAIGFLDGDHWDGDHNVLTWSNRWGDVAVLQRWSEDEDPAYLGIQIAPGDPGARVVAVVSDSPAQAAGMKVDDVVIEFDGEPVTSPSQLVQLVRAATPGEQVALRVRHDGEERSVEAALAPLPGFHR